ncbi:MAG: HipA domain-containing protein [Bilifractor sp.]
MKTLRIYLEIQGKKLLVGEIQGMHPDDAVFTYDEEYLAHGVPVSVSLPLQRESFPPSMTRCFFEGLLPEGFSRKSVANWMHADEEDYLTILAGLGKECLGAIRVVETETETDTDTDSSDKPSYKELTIEQVRQLAAEGATKSTELLVKSHLSLTGASGKVGLFLNNGKWYQPRGTAPSSHIVKQSHVRLKHMVENELLALRTAQRLGIPTARSFVVNTGSYQDSEILLATERYDRDLVHSTKKVNGMICPLRLHQEDFAQALGIPGSKKYETPGGNYLEKIFRLVRNVSENPLKDQCTLLDLLIYDKLIGNTDNHIKNISLLYSPDLRSVRLAPAYDLVSTLLYRESTSDMSIAIAGEMRWDKITRDTFLQADQEIGLSRKIIGEEYDRLQEQMIPALNAVAAEMEREGFADTSAIAQKIIALQKATEK